MALTRTRPRLAYETRGEEGSPVLLVMGLGMRGVVWRPQFEAIGEHHRVACFDNRGVGGSDPAGGPLSMREMASDALRLADELEMESFHLVGVSMGGMISQEIGLARPDRVRSLTLIATHAGGSMPVLPGREGIKRFLRVHLSRSRDARLTALHQLLYPMEFLASAESRGLDERVRDQVGTPIPRATLLAQIGALFSHATADRLGGLTMPTLVIKPGRDLLVPPTQSDRLSALIPDSELVEYPDAGHGITFQYAAALNERLLAHFAKHD